MIELDVPGFRRLALTDLVLDYNGTIAQDGELLPGVADALTRAATRVGVHVVTADTFGRAAAALAGLPVTLALAPPDAQDEWKQDYVTRLGAEHVVAVGNGRNDRRMLSIAALGIAVLQREGAAMDALGAADVVTTNIVDALALLEHPRRLVATLRS